MSSIIQKFSKIINNYWICHFDIGISSSVSLLETFENRTKEESALVYGLFSVLCSKLDEESKKLVCSKIDIIFTHTVLTSATQSNTTWIAEAVREQLMAEIMQPNMNLVTKVNINANNGSQLPSENYKWSYSLITNICICKKRVLLVIFAQNTRNYWEETGPLNNEAAHCY